MHGPALHAAETELAAIDAVLAADDPLLAAGPAIRRGYERLERARAAEQEWSEKLLEAQRLDQRMQPLQQQLASIEARFLAPGRLGDMLAVAAGIDEVRGARAVFAQQIRRDARGGELLVEGRAEVACMDTASGKARRWPGNILERLKE